jgi:RNA polymerase sigma-70 factor, ECF subfamily
MFQHSTAVRLVRNRKLSLDAAMHAGNKVDLANRGPDLNALVEEVASRGDRRAFAALFRHFAPRLKAYLVRLGADGGSAEELMQETMLTVWRRAETFDSGQASVTTWIFTIARNKRIDAVRRDRRPEFDPQDPMLVPEPGPSAEALIDEGERGVRLREAIKGLPEEQASLLQMAFFDGKAHMAIAAETSLPLGTVKSRLRLALGRLRRTLEETP